MPLKVEITQLLVAGTGGDQAAIDTPPVCDEFRRRARLRQCPKCSGAPKYGAVEPRHFNGSGIEEIATRPGISPVVVTHGWRLANAWLRCGISGESLHGS